MERFLSLGRRALRVQAAVWCALILFVLAVLPVNAAQSLLVNTESFNQIESGDGTTPIELRFGSSDVTILYNASQNRFEFNRPVWLKNNLTASGSITAAGTLSGSALYIQNNAQVRGALSASGAFRTDAGIIINDDADTTDATLTFGNQTQNQTLKYLNTAQKFQLSKGLSVIGNLSGSTLNVDGAATINGAATVQGNVITKSTLSGVNLRVEGTTTIKSVNYQFPNAQGAANTFLKNDGAGNLSWATTSVGNGSGNILSLHPEYAGAVYYGSGSTAVGQLGVDYDATNKENFYKWTSSRSTANDYWIAVRAKVPKNFASWSSGSGIQLRYRTLTTTASQNAVNVRLIDTAGSNVAITGATGLTSAVANTWTTAIISNFSGGTYTPGQYITFLIKVAANSSGETNLGYLNINWSNTVP
jgi:hypothetical protein